MGSNTYLTGTDTKIASVAAIAAVAVIKTVAAIKTVKLISYIQLYKISKKQKQKPMQTHTAKQLRSYSVKPEVEKIYNAILSAARTGDIKYKFLVPKEKEVFILLELVKLFPDTKFTEINTILRSRTLINASWPLIHTYRSQH